MAITTFTKFLSGDRLINGDKLNRLFQGNQNVPAMNVTWLTETTVNAIVATGTVKANAKALTGAINNITTATANSGVVLPPIYSTAGVGATVIIFNANTSANAVTVYGNGTDTIDGSNSVTLSKNNRCEYVSISNGVWLSTLLGATSS